MLDLTQFIRPCDTVVCGQMSAEPLTLTEALVAQADAQPDAFRDVTVFIGATYSHTFDPRKALGLRYASYGALANAGALSKAKRLAVIPAHYSALPHWFTRKALRSDVVLLQAARGRSGAQAGKLSLGSAHGYLLEAARAARSVVLEVNAEAPYCFGGELPDDLKPAAMIETSRALPTLTPPTIGAVERAIGARIAALMLHGATLQLGLGSIPDAALAGLTMPVCTHPRQTS